MKHSYSKLKNDLQDKKKVSFIDTKQLLNRQISNKKYSVNKEDYPSIYKYSTINNFYDPSISKSNLNNLNQLGKKASLKHNKSRNNGYESNSPNGYHSSIFNAQNIGDKVHSSKHQLRVYKNKTSNFDNLEELILKKPSNIQLKHLRTNQSNHNNKYTNCNDYTNKTSYQNESHSPNKSRNDSHINVYNSKYPISTQDNVHNNIFANRNILNDSFYNEIHEKFKRINYDIQKERSSKDLHYSNKLSMKKLKRAIDPSVFTKSNSIITNSKIKVTAKEEENHSNSKNNKVSSNDLKKISPVKAKTKIDIASDLNLKKDTVSNPGFSSQDKYMQNGKEGGFLSKIVEKLNGEEAELPDDKNSPAAKKKKSVLNIIKKIKQRKSQEKSKKSLLQDKGMKMGLFKQLIKGVGNDENANDNNEENNYNNTFFERKYRKEGTYKSKISDSNSLQSALWLGKVSVINNKYHYLL